MKRIARIISIVMTSVFLLTFIHAPPYQAMTQPEGRVERSSHSIVNFRDLGRYKTQDGRRITPNRLLRSGELYNLSPTDIALLSDTHNVRHIIDFRSAAEIQKGPDATISNTQYHHIEMLGDYGQTSPALALLQKMSKHVTAHNLMMSLYEHLILSRIAQAGFRQFLNIVIDNTEGSIIWHCYAGKDRTGLSAFFVLHLLGASETTIYDDYLLTNVLRKNANDIILAGLAANGADEHELAFAQTLLTVDKDYLDHAIALINTHYGSIDNYLEHVLGISATQKAQLQSMYLLD